MDNLSNRITSDAAICGGRPCIRGMRIRVSDVLEMLASGMSGEEIVHDYPDLEADDIAACLHFAAKWFRIIPSLYHRPSGAKVCPGGRDGRSAGRVETEV